MKVKWNDSLCFWEVFLRGEYSDIIILPSKKKRGIPALFNEDITAGLSIGKKPKSVIADLRNKHKDNPVLLAAISDPKQIRKMSYRLSRDTENRLGMRYMSDVSQWIDHNMLDKTCFLRKIIYVAQSECIVLDRHSTAFKDVNGVEMTSQGFVYSCRALLENIKRQCDGCGLDIGLSTDATFNLVTEGWALYSVGCRSTRRLSENLSQQYRPFAYLLSRTERGDGYDVLFESIKNSLALLAMTITVFVLFASTTTMVARRLLKNIFQVSVIQLDHSF